MNAEEEVPREFSLSRASDIRNARIDGSITQFKNFMKSETERMFGNDHNTYPNPDKIRERIQIYEEERCQIEKQFNDTVNALYAPPRQPEVVSYEKLALAQQKRDNDIRFVQAGHDIQAREINVNVKVSSTRDFMLHEARAKMMGKVAHLMQEYDNVYGKIEVQLANEKKKVQEASCVK